MPVMDLEDRFAAQTSGNSINKVDNRQGGKRGCAYCLFLRV
jgi:hypothetical protein